MNGANIVMMFNRSEGNLRAFLTSLITVELLKTRGQKIDPSGLSNQNIFWNKILAIKIYFEIRYLIYYLFIVTNIS